MNILFASSEVVPFAKTGGLADVCGALPKELERLGHPSVVFLPAYRQALGAGEPIEPTDIALDIPIGSRIVPGRLLKSRLPDSNVPVYLVQRDEYFDRPELYREAGQDYRDNCERFVFFCRAVLESIRLLKLPVDVVHAHDWQTSLLPAYLATEYSRAIGYDQLASVLTIHNLSYQGLFWHWDMVLTGLDWRYFNYRQMEFFGQLNLLKTGIVFADALTTVSRTYAQEIQSAPLGCGLEGVLQERSPVLTGIVNGVDYNVWNPATDPHLPTQFDVSNYLTGKAACKAALQREMGLPVLPGAPLIGIVGRLVNQKGFDLIAAMLERWLQAGDAQWVVLGTGEQEYQELLERLAAEHRDKLAIKIGFSDALAHRIEAGADLFLMPSLFEPCGLNQMYSLRYGTVPVVRATGGLADTIVDASPEHLADGTANGFSFGEYSSFALEEALLRGVTTYKTQPQIWHQLITTGMRQDYSWSRSAQEYASLYERTVARKRGWDR